MALVTVTWQMNPNIHSNLRVNSLGLALNTYGVTCTHFLVKFGVDYFRF